MLINSKYKAINTILLLLLLLLLFCFNSHFSWWTWFSRDQNVSILDFIGAKNDWGGGGDDSWSYKTWKRQSNRHQQQTNTLTSQWGHMSQRLSLPASLCYGSYVAFVGPFLHPFSSHWWRLSSWRCWIVETQPSLASRWTFSSGFSWWWTQLPG